MKRTSGFFVVILSLMLTTGCSQPQTAPKTSMAAATPHLTSSYPDKSEKGRYLYHYYPQSMVFFSPDRKLWFWRGAAYWGVGHILPGTHRVSPSDRVIVRMDTDKPYRDFDQIAARFPALDRSRTVSADPGSAH